MLFWVVVLSVVLVSAVFLIWVFQRDLSASSEEENLRLKRNVELYQQRMRKAAQELKKEYITEADYQLQEIELGKRLLKDIAQLQVAPKQSVERKKWLLLLAITPFLALTLYSSLGAWQDWQITQQLQALSQSENMEQFEQRVEKLHQALEKRIEQKPASLSYRMLLADYAMNKSDFTGAAAHYGVVAELLPDDDEAWARYAQAEFLRNNRVLNANVAQAMDNALQINPLNPTVLGLQGIQAAEAGDYQTAVGAWQRLLSTLPKASNEAEIIRQGIQTLVEQYGVAVEAPEAIPSGDSIEVNVSLSQELENLDPNLSVFVYARASEGPAVPLAAEKFRLKDLPVNVVLDDSKAMLEQFRLSLHQYVIIGARISFTGDAMPQEGDIRIESEAIDWREQKSINLQLK